ncbi:NADPH-dependent curcumin reductase [Nymphon striatum]|nr:NADPH-dependent curcumin reductase [Nymphon striatum]
MTGQGVGQVIASNSDDFKVGDTVTGMFGWASHGCLPARDIRKINDKLPVSTALGVLGMPGFTGWIGLNEFGRPKAGETLVVAAATGPVGSMVGQLAKAAGLRTVAIAGGAEKCRIAKETFGFDEAIDHRAFDDAKSLRKALAEAAPNGVLEAVLPLMNTHGRIPVIGTIAWYGGVDLDRPDQLPGLWRSVLVKRLSVNGLIIFDHWDKFGEFLTEVSPMVASQKLQYLEDTAQGLAAAPEAFIDMLKGGNTGKQIVAI